MESDFRRCILAKEYAKDRLQRILGKKVDDVTFPLDSDHGR